MIEKKLNLIYGILSALVVLILIQTYVIYDLKGSEDKSFEAPASKLQYSNSLHASSSDPFEHIKKMQEEMQKSFGQFNSIFADDPFFEEAFKNMGVSPLSDFKDTKDKYILELNIPGVKEQKIDIETTDNVLKIHASMESTKDTNGTNYIHKERYTQRFERSFLLPNDADMQKIESDYKDGVLKITIAKKS